MPYSPAVRRDQGGIATTAVQIASMLVNHAAVWGYVATGGAAPEVGVWGSVRGASTPEGVQVDPARVSTDFVADLPLLTAPVDGTLLATVGDTLGTLGEATKWRVPSISLNGSKTLTILGDVTLILTASTGSALDVTGNASIIIPDGLSLTVWVEGDVKVAGKGLEQQHPAGHLPHLRHQHQRRRPGRSPRRQRRAEERRLRPQRRRGDQRQRRRAGCARGPHRHLHGQRRLPL